MIKKILLNKKAIFVVSLISIFIVVTFILLSLKENQDSSPIPGYTSRQEKEKTEEELMQDNRDEESKSPYHENPPASVDKKDEQNNDSFDYKTMYKNEIAFSEQLELFYDEHPWYTKFPIDNNEYVIVWDLEKDQFRIRVKISRASTQDLKNNLTNKAVEEIETRLEREIEDWEYYVLYID